MYQMMENTVLTNSETEKQLHTTAFRLQAKKKSDKLINYFLAFYFLVGLGFAFFYDTWLIAIGAGGLCLVAYYSVKAILPGSNLYQYVLSVILGIFMAQYIYQMHGMFEMHFFAFIGSAILIIYQNWKLQIPMLLVVVVHHLAFGYLQNSGVEKIYFTQLDYFELGTFLIHFVLAGIIFFVCGLWAHQLKKYGEVQVGQAVEMGRLQKDALIAANSQKQKSEREIAQQALTESNMRFTYAALATSDAIWDRTYSEEHISWSEGFRILFGYEINKQTMSIHFWGSKVHPDDLSVISGIVEEAKNNPATKTWRGEYRFLKADGEYVFVREKAIILRDVDGKVSRTIGALQDITEIKQNEVILKELNESLEKEKYFLDSLMDNMPDAIYFKDQESKFIRVSKHMAKEFGTSVTDIIGKSDFDFQEENKARQAYRDEQDIMKTMTPKIDYIEKTVKKGGADHWVSSTKMPLINTRDELVGTFGISRDVTEVRRLEEESRAAVLDKAVAQGKFEIASDVMHDIGNAVVGFGSYMTRIRRLQDKDNPENLKNLAVFFAEHKPAITTVIGEAKAAAVVKMLAGIALTQRSNHEEINKSIAEQFSIIAHIQEILDIQRQYISGHDSQERKPINLRNIVNDSLTMLFAIIDKKGIAISLDIADDLPIIKGDRTKLTQVMLNIFKNCIEAIDKNDEEAVEKSISVSISVPDNELVIRVYDSGIGFDKTIGGELFSKGFTTKSSATGMGLYGCRAILESHEGTIDITSEGEGKGALTRIGFSLVSSNLAAA
jgi:PAS domain S-box-containing protein